MMICLKSPGSYCQEKNLMHNLYPHLSPFGRTACIIISSSGLKRHKTAILEGLAGHEFTCVFEETSAECCQQEVDRLTESAKRCNPDMIVGIGGGKILDLTKAVSDVLFLPDVIIPTVASTDAPCSSLSVLYTPEGVFDRYLHVRSCPDVVLVDTQVIAEAPVRLFSAGMGDALSTYIEARAVNRSGSVSQLGLAPTAAALALGKCCYETLMTYGRDALAAVKKKEVSFAVERVVEANTYLSGVGFESGGVAAAHALQKGMTVIPKLHDKMHGEKVAFNTIVQLCLEHAPAQELAEVIGFCRDVELPTTFAALSSEPISREEWMAAAEFTCRPGMTIHKMPFAVTPEMLVDAIYAADEAGKSF